MGCGGSTWPSLSHVHSNEKEGWRVHSALVQLAAPTKSCRHAPTLTFNPPISIDLCETAGQEFGDARVGMERAIFERELVTQLEALFEALRAADIDRDQALAVFDTAAWDAWEASKEPTAPEVTAQEQSAQ
jgi:hypothetical protein